MIVGSEDVGARAIEEFDTGGVGFAEHHAHHTAANETDAPGFFLGRIGRRKSWQRISARLVRNKRKCVPDELWEKEVEPKFFGGTSWQESQAHASGKRKDFFDGNAAQEVLEDGTFEFFLDEFAGAFEQRAILDATGAGGFAGAAAEAKIDVPDGSVFEGKAAVLEGAHYINATAWGVIFIAGFEVSGTGPEAEAAMNAGQRFCFVEERLRNRAHHGKWGRM